MSELPSPPFLQVDGVDNFRDLGGYPIRGHRGRIVRRNVVFRSAEPSRATEKGVTRLQNLGITHVFDLRSAKEIDRDVTKGSIKPVIEWSGAKRTFVPVFLDQDYSPEALALRFKNYMSKSTEGFIAAYEQILLAGSSQSNQFAPFRAILAHLSASSTPSPLLVHCTAGKDRTGVICAIILSLCGLDDDDIAYEYSLTDLGLRERKKELTQYLINNPALNGDREGAERMVGARKENMLGTLAMIRKKHGSVESFVLDRGLLSLAELEQLRDNMIVDEPPSEAGKVGTAETGGTSKGQHTTGF